MGGTPSWISLGEEQRRELEALVPNPGWRVIPGGDLPTAFPESFRAKIDSAILIAEATSTGGTYLVMNARRVDVPAGAVDVEPFGVIVNSTGSSTAGVFVHHGTWPERTQVPPRDLWDEIETIGVGDYYLTDPPERRVEGRLDELPRGDRGAFDAVVRELRSAKDADS